MRQPPRAAAALLALLLASLAHGLKPSAAARAGGGVAAADDALLSAAAKEAAAASADTSAANPFSRAGLQGRRARLFAEERAKHVAFAAKWAVKEALNAAALGDSDVTMSNVADVTPTPFVGHDGHSFNSFSDSPHSRLLSGPEHYQHRSPQQFGHDHNNEPEKLRHDASRLQQELRELSHYEEYGNIHGGITLTPKVARELADEKQMELDAVKVKLRRFDLVAKHVYDGFISRSCLGDVARAVAAALPGVSVEVLGASESLHISWE